MVGVQTARAAIEDEEEEELEEGAEGTEASTDSSAEGADKSAGDQPAEAKSE